MENQDISQRSGLSRFFHAVWSIAKAYFLTVGIFVSLIPLLVFYLAYKMQSHTAHRPTETTTLPERFVLSIDADGMLNPSRNQDGMWIFRNFFAPSDDVELSSVRAVLREAAKDTRVKGLMVRLNSLSGSSTEFAEFRRLIEKYKTESKMPVHFALSSAGNSEYLLASIADWIILSPGGGLDIPGPMLQLTYFSEALKKLGVEFEVYQAGKFKSAFEPFIRQAPSPESLEVFQSLESSLRNVMIQTVASSRNKPVEQIAGWFKQSIFVPKDAVDAGLVDQIAHPQEATNVMFTKVNVTEEVSIHDYDIAEELADQVSQSGSGVGLIRAEGEVLMSTSGNYEEEIIPARLREELKWMAEKEEVKSVVIRIDSPGGSATASELIWEEVRKLVLTKPVVVSMGNVAASGGYYIAAPATKIFADPGTITGSIGVISAIPKTPGFAEKWGIAFTTITGSDRKAIFDPSIALTPFDRSMMESSIAAVYQLFKERVATGRNIPIEKVDELAQGRVYTGIQALDLGLVDDLGGISEAFQAAKQLGSLDPEKLYPIYQYEGDEIDLSHCLRSALEFYRCLDKFQSRIGVQSLSQQIPLAHSVSRTLERLQVMSEQDRVLTYGEFGEWK
jgi:protease-4